MKRNIWLELLAVTIFLLAATALIASSGADLAISAPFCIQGKWPVGHLPFWQFFYKINRAPVIALGVIGLCLALLGYFKEGWSPWRRSGMFLVILMLLGPGFLVNSVFKEYWGRPRPSEIVEFGGKKQFLYPWQKGISGNGRSFPSGHASAAFAMTAPFFIYRRSNRKLALYWLTGGLLFGAVMSIARITQGGHFLSDCLWAWGMVHLLALVLASALRLDQSTQSPANSDTSACST